MRAHESVKFSNISASTSPFVLEGGLYAASAVATFGGGSIKLQMLGPDGSTYLDLKAPFDKPDGTGGTEEDLVIGTFLVAGMKTFYLPPGQYRFTIATASAVYAQVVRVPFE